MVPYETAIPHPDGNMAKKQQVRTLAVAAIISGVIIFCISLIGCLREY